MQKKFFPTIISLLIILTTFTSASWAASSLRDLFWQRNWPEMEAQFNSLKKKTDNDYSLMANSYRFQNKWAEMTRVLEAHGKEFPANIRPYADMTLILGYEKLKRYNEALALAENLYKNAPQDLKYYVALAQYRILKDNLKSQDNKRLESALNKMLSSAGSNERKIYT